VRVGIGGGVLVVATRFCKNAQSISAARAWRAAHESLLFDDLDAFNDRPFEWVHGYNRRRPTMAFALRTPLDILADQLGNQCRMYWPNTNA